jgi:uncharacterized protein (TIGR02391 family)
MSEYVELAKRVANAFTVLSKIRTLALKNWNEMDESVVDGPHAVKEALKAHLDLLMMLLPEVANVSNLGRHIHFNCRSDYWDIVNVDIPAIEAAVLKLISTPPDETAMKFGFDDLLHEKISATALPLYRDKHMKEAVVKGYEEVFVEIRRRTGRPEDGARLVNEALKPDSPILIIKELETESGQSIQKGYMELLRGAYQAFRNVLAHPDPDLRVSAQSAARHMIFASILMRAIVDAKKNT